MRLTLYHLPFCPYCLRVRAAAKRLGVAFDLVDVGARPEARRMLIERLGRGTVPVLGIPQPDGAELLLPESADIIDWLRQNHARVA